MPKSSTAGAVGVCDCDVATGALASAAVTVTAAVGKAELDSVAAGRGGAVASLPHEGKELGGGSAAAPDDAGRGQGRQIHGAALASAAG